MNLVRLAWLLKDALGSPPEDPRLMHGIVPGVWELCRNCAGAKRGIKNVPEIVPEVLGCAGNCAGIVHGIVPEHFGPWANNCARNCARELCRHLKIVPAVETAHRSLSST